MNTPIIRIEMEGIRAGVLHHMQQHNDDFNLIVQEQLKQTLNEDWVKHEIQNGVNKTVRSAISSLGSSWQLRDAVSNALGKSLAAMVEGDKPNE